LQSTVVDDGDVSATAIEAAKTNRIRIPRLIIESPL
jgi:hypothetical protein